MNLAELNHKQDIGFSSQNSDAQFGSNIIEPNSNDQFARLNSISGFGSNIVGDFGTANPFGSNISDTAGLDFHIGQNNKGGNTISREGSGYSGKDSQGSMPKSINRNGQHKNTMDFLMSEYQSKDNNDIVNELEKLKHKAEEENNEDHSVITVNENQTKENIVNYASGIGPGEYNSNISENSFVFNNDAFKSEN